MYNILQITKSEGMNWRYVRVYYMLTEPTAQ
jgi:hypothetical protein